MIEKIQAFFKRKQRPKTKRQNEEIVTMTGYSYLVMNKQKYTMFQKQTGYSLTVDNLLPKIDGLVPIGYNDDHTEGLVLFTNDDTLDIEHTEIEYVVKTDKDVTQTAFKQLTRGVMIKSKMLKPTSIEKIDSNHLRIIMPEIMENQIELLLQAVGYHATREMRVRIETIIVNGLRQKQWRFLTLDEINNLKHIKGDSDE